MVEKKSSAREWLIAIILAVAIAIVIRLFFFEPYEVHGTSMYPTLDGSELLIVNKMIYKVSQPKYGDIIVFHTYEGNVERDFIKRVIGLPGDSVLIRDGNVYRNGKKLEEPYINPPVLKDDFKQPEVPAGYLFVLGDNRDNSKDSRVIGPVKITEVVGRADVVVLPLKHMNLLSMK